MWNSAYYIQYTCIREAIEARLFLVHLCFLSVYMSASTILLVTGSVTIDLSCVICTRCIIQTEVFIVFSHLV